MGKTLSQFHGTRKFQRMGRWAALEETIITRNSQFAKYSDNFDSNDPKLRITFFRQGQSHIPYKKFVNLSDNIMLEDFSVLSKVNSEEQLYLEVSKDKIRLYKEVS